MNIAAGVVGLATAVLGLIGAAMGVFDGKDDAKAEPETAVQTAGPAEGIDQRGLDRDMPALIDGYMSGPAFVDLWAQKRFCYEFEAATNSCLLLGKLTQRGPREIRAQETSFRPMGYPVWDSLEQMVVQDMEARRLPRPVAYFRMDYTDYLITREGICTTNAHRAEGAALTEIIASGDASFNASTPISRQALADYRVALAETYRQGSVGGQQCWRYKIPAEARDSIDQYYFIDGVLQTSETARFYLTPNDSTVGLRLPS